VRFGLILTNQHPPGAPPVERFADAIEQVRLARDLGFDTMIFRVSWPGMPQAGILRGLRLLGEEVRPRISARPAPVGTDDGG
jgi:hypothetical protein